MNIEADAGKYFWPDALIAMANANDDELLDMATPSKAPTTRRVVVADDDNDLVQIAHRAIYASSAVRSSASTRRSTR